MAEDSIGRMVHKRNTDPLTVHVLVDSCTDIPIHLPKQLPRLIVLHPRVEIEQPGSQRVLSFFLFLHRPLPRKLFHLLFLELCSELLIPPLLHLPLPLVLLLHQIILHL